MDRGNGGPWEWRTPGMAGRYPFACDNIFRLHLIYMRSRFRGLYYISQNLIAELQKNC